MRLKFFIFLFLTFNFSVGILSQSLSIIWPKSNEVIPDRTPLLRWNGVEGVSNYQVILSLDSTFNSGVQQFSSSITTFQLTNNLASGTWFWKASSILNGQNLVSNLGKFQVFEPTDISSLCLWLRADTNLILDANGRVQQWKDLSSSGLIFNQNTVSKRPFFNSSGFNNKPILTFNGAQVLSGGDVLDLGTTSRSMFVMGNYTNTTSNGYFYAKALFGAAGSRFGFGGGSNNLFSFYLDNSDRTAQLNPGSNYSNNFLYSSVINRQNNTNSLRRNSSVLAINSNLLASHNMNSTFRFLIGAYNDATDISETLYLNGNISEIIFTNTADAVTSSIINKYLMDRSAPPVNLGADRTPIYQNNGACINETITASNIYTNYLWSSGATIQSIQVTQPGTYWVQTTDVFGRTSRDTILINNPKMTIFDFQDTLVCFNDSILITPNLPLNHTILNWSNGLNIPTQSFSAINDNLYFNILFENSSGCIIQSNKFKIIVDSSLYGISLGEDASLCSGNSIQLQNSPISIQQYIWNTGNNQPTQLVDTTGLFILEVTNINGCQNKDSLMVTITGEAPLVIIELTPILCQGDSSLFVTSATISAPESITSISWNLGDGMTNNGDSLLVSYQNSGSKNIEVSVLASNGCIVNMQQTIQINPVPNIQIQTFGTCLYDSILFSTINNGFIIQNYSWNLGQNTSSNSPTPSHVYNSSGTYTTSVIATDQNGCIDTSIIQFILTENFENYSNEMSIIWPKSNEVISDKMPLLSWNGVEGVTNYQISLSQDSTFNSGVQQFPSATSTFQLTNNLVSGNWFWMVNASLNGQNLNSNIGKFQVFEPTDISSLSLWLRADSNVVLDANGKVQQWNDLSSSNLTFSQNSITKRPIFNSNGLNNRPFLTFNGAQVLSGGDVLDLGTSSRSMFVLGNYTNTTTVGYVFAKALFGPANSRYGFGGSSTSLFSFYLDNSDRTAQVNPGGNFSNSYVYRTEINRQNNTNTLLRNSSILAVNSFILPSHNMNSSFRFLIGAYNDASDISETLYMNGNISEILFVNTVEPTITALVSKYLMDKYAPPVNLGVDRTPNYQNNGTCINETLTSSNIYTNYLWNNGATIQSIQVTQPGSYWVQTIDIFGRISRDTIVVNNPKMNIFNFQDTVLCFNEQYTITPTIPSDLSFIKWNNCNPNLENEIKPGNAYFIEMVNSQGCLVKSNVFTVSVDSSLYNLSLGADTSLCSGNSIQLQNAPAGITDYAWNTGNTQAIQAVDTSGLYILEVTNTNNCQNRDTIQVQVIGTSPTLQFTFSDTLCQFSLGSYLDNSFVPNGNGTIISKTWSISQGDTLIGSSGYFSIDTSGVFNVTLLVQTEEGCCNSTSFPLVVHPKPVISFTTEKFCPYDAVEFTSFNSQLSSLSSQLWSFDDNTTSTSPNPTRVFGTTDTYNVSLQVEDINGCRDTVIQAVYIQPAPVADFSFANTCELSSVNFVNNSNISDTFSVITNQWTYGDGTQATNPSIQKVYQAYGDYDVQLVVTANNGCQDTLSQTITIHPIPILGWEVGPACKNTWTTFENQSNIPLGSISQTEWLVNLQYPFEGTNSAYKFVTTGVQYLNLTSTSDQNCTSDTLIIVNVNSELDARFNYLPLNIVSGVPVTFSDLSIASSGSTWDMGIGEELITYTPPINQFVKSYPLEWVDSTINVSLFVENQIGCKDTISKSFTVQRPAFDLEVKSIFIQEINGFNTIGVEFENKGTISINKVDFELSGLNNSTIQETWTGNLLANQDLIYMFNAKLSAYNSTQDGQTNFLCVEGFASDNLGNVDVILENNKVCENTENEEIALLSVAPNPTENTTNISLLIPNTTEATNLNVSLYSMNGAIVKYIIKDQSLEAGIFDFNVDLTNVQLGIYLLKIEDGTTNKVIRLSKI